MIDNNNLVDAKAEAGIIATLVNSPEFILSSDYLKPAYFFFKENGCIYWAIEQLYKSGVENIDAYNISSMLASNEAVSKTLEKVNMPDMDEYIELSQDVARHSLAEYRLLAERVTELSFKRDLIKTLSSMEIRTNQNDLDLSELNKYVYDNLEKLTTKYMFNTDVLLFGEKVDSIYQEVVDRRGSNGIFGIPSKFPSLTKYFIEFILSFCLFQRQKQRH